MDVDITVDSDVLLGNDDFNSDSGDLSEWSSYQALASYLFS